MEGERVVEQASRWRMAVGVQTACPAFESETQGAASPVRPERRSTEAFCPARKGERRFPGSEVNSLTCSEAQD